MHLLYVSVLWKQNFYFGEYYAILHRYPNPTGRHSDTCCTTRTFDGKRLLVTITENAPDHVPPANPNAQLMSILLSAPALSEEDAEGFAEVRTHLNQWRSV